MILSALATGLILAFVVCCLSSAGLQLVAWARHARKDTPISIRALWDPEGHFDEIGLNQMKTAKRLLTVGILAYLGYGFLLIVMTIANSA